MIEMDSAAIETDDTKIIAALLCMIMRTTFQSRLRTLYLSV